MKKLIDSKIKVILWDFDGVLLNSNSTRDYGFIQVLKAFPEVEVSKLLEYHKKNGGLSRYVKFRYFFEKIRGEVITETQVQEYADRFSSIMLKKLNNPALLITETIRFVRINHDKLAMYIVSGSDHSELQHLCKRLGISRYFHGIHGSPMPKKDIVKKIIGNNKHFSSQYVLVGDSINDYEAAIDNHVNFISYNNHDLDDLSDLRIDYREEIFHA